MGTSRALDEVRQLRIGSQRQIVIWPEGLVGGKRDNLDLLVPVDHRHHPTGLSWRYKVHSWGSIFIQLGGMSLRCPALRKHPR